MVIEQNDTPTENPSEDSPDLNGSENQEEVEEGNTSPEAETAAGLETGVNEVELLQQQRSPYWNSGPKRARTGCSGPRPSWTMYANDRPVT